MYARSLRGDVRAALHQVAAWDPDPRHAKVADRRVVVAKLGLVITATITSGTRPVNFGHPFGIYMEPFLFVFLRAVGGVCGFATGR